MVSRICFPACNGMDSMPRPRGLRIQPLSKVHTQRKTHGRGSRCWKVRAELPVQIAHCNDMPVATPFLDVQLLYVQNSNIRESARVAHTNTRNKL